MASVSESMQSTKLQKSGRVYDNNDPDYFRLPRTYLMVISSFLIVYFDMITFYPESLPDYLGPLSQFGKYLATYNNVCFGIWLLIVIFHVLEVVCAVSICLKRGYYLSTTVKWAVTVLFFGYQSLALILPRKKRSKTE